MSMLYYSSFANGSLVEEASLALIPQSGHLMELSKVLIMNVAWKYILI
ncbi:hypothetical protein [Neobacillus novalis]|nr:hypothetical protein [Neobacillus novalis]